MSSSHHLNQVIKLSVSHVEQPNTICLLTCNEKCNMSPM